MKKNTIIYALFLVLLFGAVKPFRFYRGIGKIAPRGFSQTSLHVATLPAASEIKSTDPVRVLLTEDFPKVGAEATVFDAVQVMNQFNRGAIAILDENNELSGIFTERDFVGKILDLQLNSTEIPIKSVMTPKQKLVTGSVAELINDCRQKMLTRNIRHLPILDNKKVVGIISMRDTIRALQIEDLRRSSARFLGNTLQDIAEQAREEANTRALESGEVGKKQDTVKFVFVITAAIIGAGLLQGEWIHQHEVLAMVLTFGLGYLGIIFETFLEFNKAGIALLMSTALWTIFADSTNTGAASGNALHLLGEKVSEVSEIVFFILGAMTIVEIVDAHQGFRLVTDRIRLTSKRSLLFTLGILTFFMSALLDNLTTTIVMVSLLRKLLPGSDAKDKKTATELAEANEDRKLFGGMVVIAANAGGAWTPIGDVTTTMLWINGQITALNTMTHLFLPSFVSVLVSLFILQKEIKETKGILEVEGSVVGVEAAVATAGGGATYSLSNPPPAAAPVTSPLAPRGQLVFLAGLLGLLSVPVFKACTGLPPYLGMLAALGVMWSLTDALHAGDEARTDLTAPAALRKIDSSGVLFFLGILMSVGALDSAGILKNIAIALDQIVPTPALLATLIGGVSAIIDNVPLVAATMGMYAPPEVPADSPLWQLIAFCAGTGGSMLVIGSAAGVALMGLEKVDFMWYVRKISLAAVGGYAAGIGVYLLQQQVMGGMGIGW